MDPRLDYGIHLNKVERRHKDKSMNRQMWIVFIAWISFSLLVIVFAIIYVVIGQLDANANSLATIINTLQNPLRM